MGMYVERNLIKGETIIQKAKLSPISAILNWIVFALMGIGLIVSAVNVEQINYDRFYYGYAIATSKRINTVAVILVIIFSLFCLTALIKAIGSTIALVTNELGLTNKRLIGKVGKVSIKAMDMPLNKVQNIMVSYGLLGRIFGYGNMMVNTAGGVFVFYSVVAPDAFKNIVMEQIDVYEKQETQKNAETLARAVMVGQYNTAAQTVASTQAALSCPHCGAQNHSNAAFCNTCGAKLK